MAAQDQDQPQASGLFAIFLLAMYSLVLVPYSLYRVFGGGDDKAQAVVKTTKRKEPAWQRAARKLCTRANLALLAAWLLWLLIALYVRSSSGDSRPFDPFDILGIERGATDRDVKKAYRKLSLQYHPDKNPDPAAAAYFASHISKAYAALTDEVSRQNYEKYGHPDGPQGMNLGVALPSWMFTKDRKAAPLMLLALVGGGIILPLAVVSYYMLKGDDYSGPNRVHNATLYAYAMSKYGVKESQSLVRIPETLLVAMEFIQLYTPGDHQGPMEELRKALAPVHSDVMGRDKKAFWQRRASVIKAHMLLLAHLERLGPEVPPQLQADLKFVRSKCPPLLEEMAKIACLPRNNLGWGWMTPALASVEMMQCVASALPISARKGAGAKGGDALAPLLALPHFDLEVVKRLRKQRVNTLKDLQALADGELAIALATAGIRGDLAVDEVAASLQAIPQLSASASFEVDGEDEVCERDPVHCRVRVLLTRRSHASPGFRLKGSAVRAYTPCNPEPQDEAWWAFLVEPTGNHVLAFAKANLIDAERAALESPSAVDGMAARNEDVLGRPPSGLGFGGGGGGGRAPVAFVGLDPPKPSAPAPSAAAAAGSNSGSGGGGGGGAANNGSGKGGGKRQQQQVGQVLDLVFYAPPQGRYDLTLHLMSSTWVGADLAVPLKLRVNPLTRAAAEGRDAKTLEKRRFAGDSDDDGEGEGGEGGEGRGGRGRGGDDEGDRGSDSDSDSEDERGSDEPHTGEYDSEETGEEVSSSDDYDHIHNHNHVGGNYEAGTSAGAAGGDDTAAAQAAEGKKDQ